MRSRRITKAKKNEKEEEKGTKRKIRRGRGGNRKRNRLSERK